MRKVMLDERYSFWKTGRARRIFSHLLLKFAIAVLSVHHRLFFGLRIEGKGQLERLHGGVVTVCNHICVLDSAMVACLLSPRRAWFPTLRDNLELPFIRHLVRLLGGLPIPETPKALRALWGKLGERLEAGEIVHFFPEGELIPYCTQVRPFERGAFALACAHGAPVLPLVLTVRKNTGLQKLFRRRPSLTLTVLPPIEPQGSSRGDITALMERCAERMRRRAESGDKSAGRTASQPKTERLPDYSRAAPDTQPQGASRTALSTPLHP